jgi:acetyl/propionyl-CoA carboxylase alpha subunit
VEFLLEGEGDEARFYFLEMNTRLQVEHAVTEAVSAVDLVQAQLRVASGETLPWTQSSLAQRGHAIECRIYAEDPSQAFLPQAGTILRYQEPLGPGIRVDSGVRDGSEVSIYYDPLLAKLVVWAETRELAIRRAARALAAYAILGIRTNIAFLIAILAHPRFRDARVDTRFLEDEAARLAATAPTLPDAALAAAALHALRTPGASGTRGTLGTPVPSDPFDTLKQWRS